jgi:hypothetical protein
MQFTIEINLGLYVSFYKFLFTGRERLHQPRFTERQHKLAIVYTLNPVIFLTLRESDPQFN